MTATEIAPIPSTSGRPVPPLQRRRRPRPARFVAIAVATTAAVLAAGCTNPAPAGGFRSMYEATKITNLHFVGDWPLVFWDPDSEEEPYLVHLGLRIKVNEPIAISTFVRSTFFSGGAYMGKVGNGQSIDVGPGDGVDFYGFQLPDLFDLANGAPFELLGTVDFLLERDSIIPVGFANLLDGVSQVINAALPTILANNGALPTTLEGIVTFLGNLLPGIFATILGAVATVLNQLGGADPLIGLAPQMFIAAGGSLGSFIGSALPTLLQLVNFVLSQQNPNPFPNGLPITIGMVGGGNSATFGDPTLTSTYRVDYHWRSF